MAFMILALFARGQNPPVSADNGSRATAGRAPLQSSPTNLIAGRTLFLKNCAHCHGANAHGDEGPDLRHLDEADDWIANRIRKGKPGEMTAFAGKLQPAEIDELIRYLRKLK